MVPVAVITPDAQVIKRFPDVEARGGCVEVPWGAWCAGCTRVGCCCSSRKPGKESACVLAHVGYGKNTVQLRGFLVCCGSGSARSPFSHSINQQLLSLEASAATAQQCTERGFLVCRRSGAARSPCTTAQSPAAVWISSSAQRGFLSSQEAAAAPVQPQSPLPPCALRPLSTPCSTTPADIHCLLAPPSDEACLADPSRGSCRAREAIFPRSHEEIAIHNLGKRAVSSGSMLGQQPEQEVSECQLGVGAGQGL